MSHIYVSPEDHETRFAVLSAFASRRIGKRVALSTLIKNHKGETTSTEPIMITIADVTPDEIYFKLSMNDINSLDDDEY
jgi:hypothetical protein